MASWLYSDPKVRFLEQKPDADPLAKPGRRHWNKTTGRRLTPTNFMPIGKYRGKPMDRVPLEYLAWVYSHEWSLNDDWAPVRQYCELYVEPKEPEKWADELKKLAEAGGK